MKFDNKEDILQLTAHWQGDRFENGRPRVGDDILKRMQHVALEEAWGVLWGNGYKHQFQDEWKVVPEGKTLVGRAVTGVMVPQRPDLHDTLLETTKPYAEPRSLADICEQRLDLSMIVLHC